jgi:hypothetical protein
MNYDSLSLSQMSNCGEGGMRNDVYVNNGNCVTPLNQWWSDNWQPCYHWYYPQITVYEDKMSKAFKICKTLMDKKIVTVKTIKDFIDLVDTISREL